MSFNTYFFVLVFLPIAVVGYHMLNRKNHYILSKWFILVMSFWFAFVAGWQRFLVCIGLILLNYAVYRFGFTAEGKKASFKKRMLTAGVLINIVSLAFFKYLSVFMIHDTEGKIIGGPDVISKLYNVSNILVPLGISFITFSQISFLVDTYRDSIDERDSSISTYSLLDYAVYVLYFPKVTMGPIALSKDFMVQLNEAQRKDISWDNISKGLMSFIFGLSKKVLIADLLAGYVGYGYDYTPILGMTNAWLCVLAYTLQIYFDFSGFCDMASGISMMLNIDVPVNFNSPYRSLSIGEFWDRWHITLTRFFTKYVYIPLGGNRKGTIRTYINIMIVFLISGIWHGSTVNFVIWGLIHGVLSCISRAIKPYEDRIPKIVRWLVTFICINLAWVYFRAPSLAGANLMIKELFSFKMLPIDANYSVYAFPAELEIVPWLANKFTSLKNTYVFNAVVNVSVVLFALFASVKMKNTQERIESFKPTKGMIAVSVLLLVWSIMSMSEVATFIYVNF